MPFERLGTVSYLLSTVTMAVSVAVCETSSIKEWHDLQNWVRGRSSRFHRVSACGGQTDGRADGQNCYINVLHAR